MTLFNVPYIDDNETGLQFFLLQKALCIEIFNQHQSNLITFTFIIL